MFSRLWLTTLILPCCFLLFCTTTIALPVTSHQNERRDSTTLMTVQTTDTVAGLMTESCIITLTPITDKDGQPAVEEVSRCSITMDNGAAGDNSSSPENSPSSVLSTSTTSSSASEPLSTIISSTVTSETVPASSVFSSSSTSASTSSSSEPAKTSSSSATVQTTTSSVPASTSVAAPVHVNGLSTVSVVAPTTSIPAESETTAALPASSPSPIGAAAAAEDASPSPFTLPGKSLSVLPIGLGVFAGISVIALIVVGLVTYERTKYRKAFRQRKLAESGAGMGYGGMAPA